MNERQLEKSMAKLALIIARDLQLGLFDPQILATIHRIHQYIAKRVLNRPVEISMVYAASPNGVGKAVSGD